MSERERLHMSISKILIVGAGQMGAGIAQVAARLNRCDSHDISVDCARRGLDRISNPE